MNGKGDKRRPVLVDDKTVTENWERTFGKKSTQVKQKKPVTSDDS